LEAFLNKYEVAGEEPSRIALALVQEGLLTNFQARQLLKGRYRGFAIGKYLVLEQLGEGGMGKVFLCEHMVMRRRVAIKVLARELASDPSTLLRFQQEARAVAALDHPNIVRAHDVDSEGDNHFIVMEYVDGTSLHDIVRKRGPLEPTRAAYFIKQAAIGLEQVMQAGMVHRDIKPGNLLLDRKGNIKILDLGLARFEEERRESVTQKFDEGSVLGTADYLSPEQAIDSHDVDIRTDIYSLGATFYFLLTGRPPFEGGTVTQKLLFHQMKDPEPLSKLRPDVPSELVAIVEKMMAKDRNRRYQTPSEVVAALEPWTKNPPPPPSEDEMPKLSLAAQRAGTPDANPLPNLPPMPAPSISRTNLSSVSQRRLQNSAAGRTNETSTSSVVHLSGTLSGVSKFPGRTGPASGSMHRRPGSTIRRRRGRRRLVIIGLAVAVGLILAGWLFWPRRSATGEQVFYVSQSGAGSGRVVKSINEALRERDPNRLTRIIVRDADINENIRLVAAPSAKKQMPIIIEAEQTQQVSSEGTAPVRTSSSTRTVRWRTRPGNQDPLLIIDNLPGVEIRNFEFDGQNQLQNLVVVRGLCPRLMLDGCEFLAARGSHLKFEGAQGVERGHITVNNARFVAGEATNGKLAFVEFASTRGASAYEPCRAIDLAGDLNGRDRIATGILISGPVADINLRSITLKNLETGILIAGSAVAAPSQEPALRLIRARFERLQRGMHFEGIPLPGAPFIELTNSGFLHVRQIASHSADDIQTEPLPAVIGNLQWIWHPEISGRLLAPGGAKRYFRRTFQLVSQPDSAQLNFACLDRCRVLINDRLVTRSPVNFDGRVTSLEISQHLVPGPNVIAVEAEVLSKTPKLAGLLVLLVIPGIQPIVSDSEWRVAMQPETGWTTRSFSDEQWVNAEPFLNYGDRRQPQLAGLLWEREIVRKFQRFWTPISSKDVYRNVTSREGYPFVGAPLSDEQGINDAIAMVAPRATTPTQPTTPTKPASAPTPPTR
jgi:serine/threonine protein kinase